MAFQASLHEGVNLDGELGQDRDHQHDSQDRGPHRIFVWTWVFAANHRSPSGILVHTVADECNRNWQQNYTIELRPRAGIRKCNNGDGRSSEQHGCMQPSEKCALIGEKDFRFHLDGDFALSCQSSNFAILTTVARCPSSTKQFLPKRLFWRGRNSSGRRGRLQKPIEKNDPVSRPFEVACDPRQVDRLTL